MTNKKITNLAKYKTILPYASEIFGVYQPLIGWKSKRVQERLSQGLNEDKASLLSSFAQNFRGIVNLTWNNDKFPELSQLEPGIVASVQLVKNHPSLLIRFIAEILPEDHVPKPSEWREIITFDTLKTFLQEKVFPVYQSLHSAQIREMFDQLRIQEGETEDQFSLRREQAERKIQTRTKELISQESALAGVLLGLLESKLDKQLEEIYYKIPDIAVNQQIKRLAESLNNPDPFLAFDPKKDIKDVTLSPIGIVHLYRQYFFELDTFLGTPTGHIWLSPGSTVELIEVSTRKSITEKFSEFSTESIVKTETSIIDQDEISDAIKEDNKSDLKLGASATVNQSWATGNASATASLNMNTTQGKARETAHKRMRQQSEKLSTEIRKNFKSTFKTITETTDTSSKRYVLTNRTDLLINYELRRKMRQVGVQIQDIGTYLCWETFVDEPGRQLGLADLVHLSTPADLQPQPDQQELSYPPDVYKSFQLDLAWDFNGSEIIQRPDGDRLIILKTVPLPVLPDSGYELELNDNLIPLYLVSTSKGDQRWAFGAKLKGSNLISLGVWVKPAEWIPLSSLIPGLPIPGLPPDIKIKVEEQEGISFDDRIDFVVSGTLKFVLAAAKKAEIDAANTKIRIDKESSNRENLRKQKEAFVKAAKERINLASKIKTRKFEELREEERIVVYRNLIKSLMSDGLYNLNDTTENQQARHTLSELINSIFDVEKMLYFVAPEWWKPRERQHQSLGTYKSDSIFSGGRASSNQSGNDSTIASRAITFNSSKFPTPTSRLPSNFITNWAGGDSRLDNYFITEESEPARMGSSLGWLLQLDGDNLRNAFLNAPWVKAVIPIRPGKEQEAINWLQQVNVEGTDGLDAFYNAPQEELDEIPHTGGDVTLRDAINHLCIEVAEKHKKSLEVGRYPKDEINDDNRVSATPVDKVYEHGFYPLQGGFRAITSEPFEICDQWIEVLPTDQVVPIEVNYNPKTGRQDNPKIGKQDNSKTGNQI